MIGKSIRASKRLNTRLLIEGFIVGIVAGSVTILYRSLIAGSEKINGILIDFAKEGTVEFILWLLFMAVTGFVISFLVKKFPHISGSGIPQVEAEVQGHLEQSWYKVLLAKIAGGALAIMGGLSLGREGPSIQLGAMAGKGIAKGLKRVRLEERHLLTCGAAAGLSAAFGAPLAGAMFALEEVHKNFSASAIISVMGASITADFMTSNVFGLSPIFDFTIPGTLPIKYYGLAVGLGLVTGACGVFYNWFVEKTDKLYGKLTLIKAHHRVFIPLVLSGILSFVCPCVLCGGHRVMAFIETEPAVSALLLVLAVKFLFSVFSFCAGPPGGIFFPLLILGCLIGDIYGTGAIDIFGADPGYLNNFIILGMAGLFAAAVRAPLTGIILIAEMSGTLSILLPLALVSFVSYIFAAATGSVPIYEYLLRKLLRKEGKTAASRIDDKEIISFMVEIGSDVEGHEIQEIKWPEKCLIVAVKRGNGEIIPHGDTGLLVGDQVVCVIDIKEGSFDMTGLEKLFKTRG